MRAEPDALSATEAAQFCGLSLKDKAAAGQEIPAKKAGRRWVCSQAEGEEWLKQRGPQVSLDLDESPWGPGNRAWY